MASSIENVFMVEASRELRETQKKLLCGPDAPSTESNAGCHSPSKYGSIPIVWTETIKSIPIGEYHCNPFSLFTSSVQLHRQHGLPLHPLPLYGIESDKTPFIVAHEFFDALPIHIFQSAPATTSKPSPSSQPDITTTTTTTTQTASSSTPPMEWREMMVSIAPPNPTTTTTTTSHTPKSHHNNNDDEPPPEFQLVLSSSTTRHSRYLPESSPRYRRLRDTSPNGALIEICPDASLYAADFAARIGGSPAHPKARPSGAALILDYGTADTVPVNSLRGIRHHRLVSPFSAPGLVDLSADVDFHAIAEAATLASDGVEVHGPVTQADFLMLMGIRERAEALTKAPGVTPAKATDIEKAWKRLVDRGPNGMGKVYKVLAILPENDGRRRPVGFGGDVTEA
jgi:SAM-dependent MidA family methyltransferase